MFEKLLKFSVIFLFVFLLASCQPHQERKQQFIDKDLESIDEISDQIEELIEDEKSIFYGLYSPFEVSQIFERIGAVYTPQILNPIGKSSLYSSSSKIALNLGVYSVDLSYIEMFNHPQDGLNYMLVINKLARELGIPEEILIIPLESFEKNLADTDSLVQMAITTFAVTENYLKEQNRESAAGLIILGSWVEALYIATTGLYDEENPNQEIIERIAEQKYSLNSLISLMKNYYDDPMVVYYLRMLKVLKKYFDEFEIYFDKGDFEIDTVNQVIKASKNHTVISREIVFKIKSIVEIIRGEIII
ncbi:hypothetical protein ES705_22419 [subsurface metagenome]